MAPIESLGEQRVRVSFNVEGNTHVNFIKKRTAELINICESLKSVDGGIPSVDLRLIALAQTAYEEAAMWAVKAATA